MNTAIKQVSEPITQFSLTKNVLNNLSQYNITPVAKLVLLYLTSCYNPKHKEIFPKQKTIALKLGISERSVTRAIQELFKEGLILIECKYTNRYKFTSRIAEKCPDVLSDNKGQNAIKETDNLSLPYIEQKRITKKEQTDKGDNVYSDDAILRDYAIKHGARNINAYVNTLKSTGSAAKIIQENQKKQFRNANRFKQTEILRQKREEEKQNRSTPSKSYIEWGIKHGIKK